MEFAEADFFRRDDEWGPLLEKICYSYWLKGLHVCTQCVFSADSVCGEVSFVFYFIFPLRTTLRSMEFLCLPNV